MGHPLLVAVPKFEQGDVPESISGEAFSRAIDRSLLSKDKVGKLLRVSRSTIYNLIDNGISDPDRVEQVTRVMGLWLRDDHGNPFDGYTDRQLTEELQRRLDERR